MAGRNRPRTTGGTDEFGLPVRYGSAVKCRGREYLRIIYGPEYTVP